MNDLRAIYTVRGTGLAFTLGAILFALSGQWLSFAVIPLGAGVGLVVGIVLARGQRPGARLDGAAHESVEPCQNRRPASLLRKLLLHRQLAVRFIGLFALGTLFFTLAWYVGYYLLPAGALRGERLGDLATQGPSSTVLAEWIKIIRWNLIVPLAAIVLANALLRCQGYPLGYVPALLNSVLYGLVLGTNSFAVPMALRLAPSLAVLGRAGPYEFAGYFLVAAATSSLAHFEVNSFSETHLRRVVPAPRLALSGERWVGVALGVALLAFAAWREAAMIVGA